MIGTPGKPGTPKLKPSTSLGAKPSAKAPTPTASATKASAGKAASGLVDKSASAAKSARIYGGGAGSTPVAAKSAAKPSFGNVRAGASSTAPAAAKKSIFGNVVGGVVSSAASAPRALPSTYTVLQGDNLSKIAKRLYGKASAWRKLFEANSDQIKDPDLIHPGQVLKVPEL